MPQPQPRAAAADAAATHVEMKSRKRAGMEECWSLGGGDGGGGENHYLGTRTSPRFEDSANAHVPSGNPIRFMAAQNRVGPPASTRHAAGSRDWEQTQHRGQWFLYPRLPLGKGDTMSPKAGSTKRVMMGKVQCRVG